jgi:O-antigen ligase
VLNSKQTGKKPSLKFWILALFLVLLFATGGASRIDVQSLIILRPLTIVFCVIACFSLRIEHWAGRKWLLVSVIAMFCLALLHLVPLPPSFWQSLAGREELVVAEKLVGLKDVWRPLTLTPMNGWHALASLFVPLTVILFGVQLNREDLFRLLPLLIGLAALSGLIGLLQAIGDPQGPLYFYRMTNNGTAVGFFANRNHAATLLACLFPMLSIYASTAKGDPNEINFRKLLASSIAIIVVPLILVTGSRSGLIIALIGIVAAGILYRRPENVGVVKRTGKTLINITPILFALVVICLAFLTFFFSQAKAIDRLFDQSAADDMRTDYWSISLDLFWKYFPFGSGSGSFVEAYKINEPTYMLNANYLNHAHNDWIETAVTFGFPGVAALVITIVGFALRAYQLWRRQNGNIRAVAYGRLASVTIFMIAIASLSDYPLRTPIMLGVFAVFALWLTEADRKLQPSAARHKED